MIILYGIHNCDSVRRVRRQLEAAGIAYHYHDLRRDGLDRATLDDWLDQLGWEALLNRRSSSWRQLPEATRQAAADRTSVAALLLAQPTLIKRPILQQPTGITLGTSAADDLLPEPNHESSQ